MFVVNTNVAKGDVPPALLSEATEELAKAMGKPVQVGQNVSNPRLLFIRVHSRFTFRALTPRRMLSRGAFRSFATGAENIWRNQAQTSLVKLTDR